jgi:hypothetical protein
MSTTIDRTTITTGTMRRRHRSDSRWLATPLVSLLLTLAVFVGAAAVDVDAASAATLRSGGSPGHVTVGKVRASKVYNAEQATHLVSLTVDSLTVGRSPAIAGTQGIVVHTELWQHGTSTGWRVRDRRTQALHLSSGSAGSWPVTFNSLGSGFYFVRQYVTWGTNWAQIDYNHPADYLCSTGVQLLCTPYKQGYVYVHWPVR